MKVTAKEFAAQQNIDPVMANSVLNFLETKQVATVVEHRKSATGKGRSAKVYEVPDTITITL